MKKRIDTLIFEKGLIDSRERAKALILSGNVYVNGQRIDKPGEKVDEDAEIIIKEGLKYVSRGGYKLEKAISFFNIDVKGLIAMDIGASTGGFTDCLVLNGIKKVYAIDVGYGQFSWKLRNMPNIVCIERKNIRYLQREEINDEIDLIVCDVSFISLKLISQKINEFLKENGIAILLIKPQFEAGKEEVGKKGVVRDKKIHVRIINEIVSHYLDLGFSTKGLTHSPIKGPEGNIEYLLYIEKEKSETYLDFEYIEQIVNNAFNELNN
ncbi:TlyA family RNA methyltransferase [Caldicellulosiruptoraceae bacterium PP1]